MKSKHPDELEFASVAARSPKDDTSKGTERRHILPNDLSGALTYLSDGELQALSNAVYDERDRRQKAAQTANGLKEKQQASRRSDAHNSRLSCRSVEPPPLTRARINAIRAAIKAGLKPTTVARQFGVSLSMIQRALAS